ncbi:MAG: hypothetical protein QOD99_1284, partial [Chthoniobacter sp.]|nr:hypothetical protein [Chthoniobacter sp.]
MSTVPPTSFSSDASSLEFVVSDLTGNALIVVAHTFTNNNTAEGAGFQLLLLNPHGKLLASGEIPTLSVNNTVVIPLSNTAKK